MTTEETRPEAEVTQGAGPFAAPAYALRKVPFDARYSWLAAGWRDMWSVPRVSLAYGAIFAIAGLLLSVGLTEVGLQSMILVLAAGFILVGPMIAAGLYETSRRLEKSEPVSLASTLRAGFFEGGQLAHMGPLLMLIYLAWVEIAFLLFMLTQPMPPLEAFVPTLLLTPRGLGLLIVGTGAGMALAATVFAVSAVAVPLLTVERVDVVTAALTSIGACRKNPKAMALWAALIAGAMLFGFVMLFPRPCDYVPVDRSRDLVCLPRSGRAWRRILSCTVRPVCENSIHFRSAVKSAGDV